MIDNQFWWADVHGDRREVVRVSFEDGKPNRVFVAGSDCDIEAYEIDRCVRLIERVLPAGCAADVLRDDLSELMALAGMDDFARPQSPHQVFQEALGKIREKLDTPDHAGRALTVEAIHQAFADSDKHDTGYVGRLQVEDTDDVGEPTGRAFTLIDGYFDLQRVVEILQCKGTIA